MPITVLTGDDTGLVKQVALSSTLSVVHRWGTQASGCGVSRLSWGPGNDEAFVGAGTEDGAVRFWRRPGEGSEAADVDESWPLVFSSGEGSGGPPFGGGPAGIVGLNASAAGGTVRVCAANRRGRVRVWAWPDGGVAAATPAELLCSFETGKVAAVARVCDGGDTIALGGKNADASLWSIEAQAAVWRARNPPNDELDLEVPIWISDLRLVGPSGQILATGHGFVQQRLRGEVRLHSICMY